MSKLGSVAHAYCYLVVTGTVGYALVNRTPNYAALAGDLSAWMTIHGALTVLAGLAFRHRRAPGAPSSPP